MHIPKIHHHKKVHHIKLHNPIEVHFDVVSRYHYYIYTTIFFSKIPLMWQLMSLLFLTPPMDYFCEDSLGDEHNSSRNICPCKNPRWDRSVFPETLQSAYGLLCESAWLVGLSHSMLYLGVLLGAFAFGFFSDRYGRLLTCSICNLIMGIFGCLAVVMPTMTSFIFMRLILGAGVGGAVVSGYVLCIEYSGLRHREAVTALCYILLNVGHLTLAGVSYILRNYSYFQLAVAIPAFFFAGMYLCYCESPKWLMDNDQIDKAASAMEKIAKFNKTTMVSIKAEMEAYQAQNVSATRQKLQFWHIFRHRRLVINFMCMAANYFLCGLGYYGVSQYIGQMSGDIHVNVAISGALLLPATIAAAFMLRMLSRRTFLMASNFIAGVFMLIVVFIPTEIIWARMIIACICNSAFMVSFIIVFLYGTELFPTAIRNSVLGVLNVTCRIGQIVVPFVNYLPAVAAGSLFGGLAIIGGFLCIPLPETKYTELPSTLKESENLPRKVSVLEEDIANNAGINIEK